MFGIRTHIVKRVTISSFSLLALLILSGCEQQMPVEKEVIRPVRAIQIADAGQVKRRSFPGKAKAIKEVELSFRVGGPLITLPVDVGDEISEGSVLSKIDPRDFEVTLNNTRGQLNKAQANAERAQSEYDREMRILKQDPGATSQVAVDRKKAQRDQTRADVTSLTASVSAARDQLKYTQLLAPFNGVIVNKYVENFESVSPGQKIIRMIDDSKIEMIVNIPESLISRVKTIEKVYVQFDSFPSHTLNGTVKEISSEASKTTRTYPVTIEMEQLEDIKVLPGMAGKTVGVDFKEGMDEEQQGINVPVSAIYTQENAEDSYVWIISDADKTVTARKVTVGSLTDYGILITEGLKVGEWIATAGANYLREGQQVKIMQSDKE